MFGLALALPSWAVEFEEGQEELIRTVILHNEAARARIHSYTLTQEWDVIDRVSRQPNAESGEAAGAHVGKLKVSITSNGSSYALTKTEHWVLATGEIEDKFIQGVLNEKYFAYYQRDPIHLVYLWEHTSLNAMKKEVEFKAHESMPVANPLDYMFGSGEQTIQEALANSPPSAHWSIDKDLMGETPVYRITMAISKDGAKPVPRLVFFVDPERDFLALGTDAFRQDGSHSYRTRVELARAEDGTMWYPKKLSDENIYEASHKSECVVTFAQFNQPLSDSSFDIGYLDLLPDTRLFRYAPGSDFRTKFVWKNGQWMKN